MLQAMQVGQTAGKIIVREIDTARAQISKTDTTEILIPHRANTTLREEICRETRRTKGTEHFRNTARIRIRIPEILISGET